jgi:PhoPQ-activated pathogenicity-related protein
VIAFHIRVITCYLNAVENKRAKKVIPFDFDVIAIEENVDQIVCHCIARDCYLIGLLDQDTRGKVKTLIGADAR